MSSTAGAAGVSGVAPVAPPPPYPSRHTADQLTALLSGSSGSSSSAAPTTTGSSSCSGSASAVLVPDVARIVAAYACGPEQRWTPSVALQYTAPWVFNRLRRQATDSGAAAAGNDDAPQYPGGIHVAACGLPSPLSRAVGTLPIVLHSTTGATAPGGPTATAADSGSSSHSFTLSCRPLLIPPDAAHRPTATAAGAGAGAAASADGGDARPAKAVWPHLPIQTVVSLDRSARFTVTAGISPCPVPPDRIVAQGPRTMLDRVWACDAALLDDTDYTGTRYGQGGAGGGAGGAGDATKPRPTWQHLDVFVMGDGQKQEEAETALLARVLSACGVATAPNFLCAISTAAAPPSSAGTPSGVRLPWSYQPRMRLQVTLDERAHTGPMPERPSLADGSKAAVGAAAAAPAADDGKGSQSGLRAASLAQYLVWHIGVQVHATGGGEGGGGYVTFDVRVGLDLPRALLVTMADAGTVTAPSSPRLDGAAIGRLLSLSAAAAMADASAVQHHHRLLEKLVDGQGLVLVRATAPCPLPVCEAAEQHVAGAYVPVCSVYNALVTLNDAHANAAVFDADDHYRALTAHPLSRAPHIVRAAASHCVTRGLGTDHMLAAVFELSSGHTRIGLAGDDAPLHVYPTIVADAAARRPDAAVTAATLVAAAGGVTAAHGTVMSTAAAARAAAEVAAAAFASRDGVVVGDAALALDTRLGGWPSGSGSTGSSVSGTGSSDGKSDCKTKVVTAHAAAAVAAAAAFAPVRRGVVRDWAKWEQLFDDSIRRWRHMCIEPPPADDGFKRVPDPLKPLLPRTAPGSTDPPTPGQPLSMLLTESLWNLPRDRERMVAHAFDTYGRDELINLCLTPTAPLALYASGRTTGVVVEMSADELSAVPIYESYALRNAAVRASDYDADGNYDGGNISDSAMDERLSAHIPTGHALTRLTQRLTLARLTRMYDQHGVAAFEDNTTYDKACAQLRQWTAAERLKESPYGAFVSSDFARAVTYDHHPTDAAYRTRFVVPQGYNLYRTTLAEEKFVRADDNGRGKPRRTPTPPERTPDGEYTSPRNYELPDGTVIPLHYTDRCQIGEALFAPHLLALDAERAATVTHTTAVDKPPAHALWSVSGLVHEAVSKNAPHDMRADCYHNIVLSGGTSLIDGIESRLRHSLEHQYHVPRRDNRGYYMVVCAPERRFSVWIGASILASLQLYKELGVTRADYDECGAAVVHRKCMF